MKFRWRNHTYVIRMKRNVYVSTEPSWTETEIATALSRAEQLILERLGTNKPADITGLLSNVAMTFLTDPGMDLDQAVDACYDESPETVIGWAIDSLNM